MSLSPIFCRALDLRWFQHAGRTFLPFALSALACPLLSFLLFHGLGPFPPFPIFRNCTASFKCMHCHRDLPDTRTPNARTLQRQRGAASRRSSLRSTTGELAQTKPTTPPSTLPFDTTPSTSQSPAHRPDVHRECVTSRACCHGDRQSIVAQQRIDVAMGPRVSAARWKPTGRRRRAVKPRHNGVRYTLAVVRVPRARGGDSLHDRRRRSRDGRRVVRRERRARRSESARATSHSYPPDPNERSRRKHGHWCACGAS